MGILQRILGDEPKAPDPRPVTPAATSADEQAIERYRYLLRTAPPEAIEQAHAEAFAQLTPEQRAQVLRGLSSELPQAESGAYGNRTDPQTLARMATRAELRQPGTLERTFGGGGGGGGMGMGGMFGGTLLSSIAGTFIGTAIAHQFLGGFDGPAAADAGGGEPGQDEGAGDEGADDFGEAGGDLGDAGGDFGGDLGDL